MSDAPLRTEIVINIFKTHLIIENLLNHCSKWVSEELFIFTNARKQLTGFLPFNYPKISYWCKKNIEFHMLVKITLEEKWAYCKCSKYAPTSMKQDILLLSHSSSEIEIHHLHWM